MHMLKNKYLQLKRWMQNDIEIILVNVGFTDEVSKKLHKNLK